MKLNNFAVNKLIKDIKNVHIQGASAVARASVEVLEHALISYPPPINNKDWEKIKLLAEQIANLRPTEPLARNLLKLFINNLKVSRSVKNGFKNWPEIVRAGAQECLYLYKEVAARLTDQGSRLVRSRQAIFTHCHSSLAETILIKAKTNLKKSFAVWQTETRPLYQGHITAKNLTRIGIKTTLVADGAAGWLVSNHSGDDVTIDRVLLGCDSLSPDGSVINKIGSFGIALAAHDSKIPVLVACPLLKMDADKKSSIEIRPRAELWPQAPANIKIINYAFDRVPAEYITGLITEAGVIKPQQALKLARRKYPVIFH